ncbi:MAG TPA: RIP metalloprotease RseP [Terriglobia bacterium]|nr:RIP metalloprotease RseP [Terriglobia bacterium]
MTSLSNAATDIVVVIIALGLMVFIHEFGHFMAAKWMGVRVLTFSFGFGKRLLGKKNGKFTWGTLQDAESEGTDYRLSLLPLGGYVKMAGEDPSQTVSALEGPAGATRGDAGDFAAHPRWQRFIIVVMGPVMNVLLAVALLAGLYRFHYEEPAFQGQQARIGEVAPDSPAAKAGLVAGDLLTRVGNISNPKWEDVDLQVAMSPGKPLPVTVVHGVEAREVELVPRAQGRDELGYAGWSPCMPAQIDEVSKGSPASHAGLKKGDRIKALDGAPVLCSQDLITALQKGEGKPVELTVERAGSSLQFQVTPELGSPNGHKQWLIGVGLRLVLVKQLPWAAAFTTSVQENVKSFTLSFTALGKIVTRQMSTRSLAGPIGIAQMSGEAYRAGIADLISVTAFISLQLAIINLLPIPVMDGGVIFLLLIETVMQRDLSIAFKERVVQVGLAFLLLLIVFIMYNDLVKTFQPG